MASAAPSVTVPAHDPNIKYGPDGNVSPSQRLDYKVEYENEGEGIAYGVYFTDTMDEDLDDSTLQVGPVIDVKTGQKIAEPGVYNPQTRTITWLVGEVASKQGGYAELSVNVKDNSSAGAEIINFATVYFPSVPEVTRTNGIVNKVSTATDNTPPITTATPSPAANSSGWNNSDITVTLTVNDNEGGSGVAKTEYSLDNLSWFIYTEPLIITTEGTTKAYYKSTDNAGNTEQAKSLELKIDKTPPTITAQALPQPNQYDWNNTNVNVSFIGADELSGIATVTESVVVITEGKDQNIGGEAVDIAGNRATTYITLSIDKTPPILNLTATPDILWPPNHKLSDVTIGGSASDSLSGIALTSFKLTDEYKTTEPLITGFNSTIQIESWRNGDDLDGRVYTITATTKDKADNQTTATTTVICPHDQGKK
jgi:hypothetical protein